MSTHNINIYKISKVLSKEGPQVIRLLDDTYPKLAKFNGWAAVRQLMREMQATRESLAMALENANKVKQLKGKINE